MAWVLKMLMPISVVDMPISVVDMPRQKAKGGRGTADPI